MFEGWSFLFLEKPWILVTGSCLFGRTIARTGSSIVKKELGESRVLDNIQMVSRDCLGENGACRSSATMGRVVTDWQRRVSNERERRREKRRRRRHSIRGPWVENPQIRSKGLGGGLVLRRHATRHGVLAALLLLLLLLQVLVVGHLLLLFAGHIARVHTGAHGPLWRVDTVSHVLGGVGGDIGGIDIVTGSGVWRIQTSLVRKRPRSESQHNS